MEAEHLLFEEVLDSTVPNSADRRRARRSRHQEFVLEYLRGETFESPTKWFTRESLDRHPGLAVVDIDRDGFDDLYVMASWGRNMLFRNRGDGTFEEIASRICLDVKDHTSCAVFADFDKDGDSEVFLGGTLARSMYLSNENGRFVDRPESVGTPLPYLVSSISAVDDNQDGLLEVYFSTYAYKAIRQALGEPDSGGLGAGGEPVGMSPGKYFFKDFLPEDQARELHRRYLFVGDPILDCAGPPNLLLQNMGTAWFEFAPCNQALQVWRSTYQASWGDFDGDGDPDVYLANDFAPNNLLRNDGNQQFTDVTPQTGTADIGFGMGVSWGDYDNDQNQDLYVTNMFRKAGRRITAKINALNPLYARMAGGNSSTSTTTATSTCSPPVVFTRRRRRSRCPLIREVNSGARSCAWIPASSNSIGVSLVLLARGDPLTI